MEYQGHLHKMRTALAEPVNYTLILGDQQILLNECLGKSFKIQFAGQINCINCGRVTKKSYSQGYCFPCSQRLASCDSCILKPELCHYHLGTCREPEWGEQNCFIPHIIYLANTSGIKVGITRETQVPTRWIDQGAESALPIARVQSRRQSGLVEVTVAQDIADKTNWRKMLKGPAQQLDLTAERNRIFSEQGYAIQKIAEEFDFGDIELLTNESVVSIQFPVLEYLEKISSKTLVKNPVVSGKLLGIKGQYLIFDTGVFNVRNHTAYWVNLTID